MAESKTKVSTALRKLTKQTELLLPISFMLILAVYRVLMKNLFNKIL